MACMASDKSAGPLLPPQLNQKRCSLPGPSGSLNLYATHQQRRLSERGLLTYRPSKPDIDLIGDFLNPTKNKSPSPSTSASSGTTSTVLPTIPSPSKSQQSSPSTSFGSSTGKSNNGNTSGNAEANFSAVQSQSDNAGGVIGGRKVVLKIQRNAGAKEKFVEIGYSPNSPMSLFSSKAFTSQDENSSILCKPTFDSRRFSDSIATRPPPQINITPDANLEAGIICTTGDLLTLKCLTSSAQEIRYYSSPYGSHGSSGYSPTEDRVGNRSRSFDATYSSTMPRKCAGSSWFSRRHLPISVKLPLPVKSPSIPNSPGPSQLKFKTPILTVTNENRSSELIEIPSPPAVTPASSADNLEEKTKVTWDKSGFVLDASVLGFAIENHLRQIDMGRRATFSTLYEAGNSDDEEIIVPMRMRSHSAIVIPSQENPTSQVPTIRKGDGSIFPQFSSNNRNITTNIANKNPSSKATSSTTRRMSLASTMTGSSAIPSRFQLKNEGRQGFQRTSLTQPFSTSVSISKPDKLSAGGNNGNGNTSCCSRGRSQSYVETIDGKVKVGMTKTTTQSSFLSNKSSSSGSRVFNQLNQNVKNYQDESNQMNKAFFRKSSNQSNAGNGNSNSSSNSGNTATTGGSSGLSICSAIRDFIVHSLKS